MWQILSQRDKILHTHSHCKLTYFWASPQLSFWYLKNILLKTGFNTAAVHCSGSSQLYSVTTLDPCLYNTSVFSPESNRCIRRTFPCWNISTEHYPLASGIIAHWRINRPLLLFFMQPTASREVQRWWIWETAHHIFSHAATEGALFPTAHQTITQIAPLVSGTEISPGHIRPLCTLGSNGFQPSSLFMKTFALRAAEVNASTV